MEFRNIFIIKGLNNDKIKIVIGDDLGQYQDVPRQQIDLWQMSNGFAPKLENMTKV